MTTHRYPIVDFIGATRVGGTATEPRRFTSPDDWFKHAACIGTDPESFTVPDSGQVTKENRYVMERVCATCPVRRQCGEYADENRLEGVWGGVARFRSYYPRRKAQDLVIDEVARIAREHPTWTVTEVADRAGCSPESIYRNFRDVHPDLYARMRGNGADRAAVAAMTRKGAAA